MDNSDMLQQEKEANIFAVCLLIPKHLIEEDLK